MIFPISGEMMKEGEDGFTLVELLLVTALLVVLAGVVFPRMATPVRNRSIESNAADLAHFIQFSRREAMRLEEDLVLHIAPDGGSYWLTEFEQGDEGGAGRFFEERHYFSHGIVLDETRRNGERVELLETVFSPSGAAAEFSYRLRDREGRERHVVTGSWVDEVSVRIEED